MEIVMPCPVNGITMAGKRRDWSMVYNGVFPFLLRPKLHMSKKKEEELPKVWAFHFFFSRPGAGLTNRVHVQHSDSTGRVPLIERPLCKTAGYNATSFFP